jgi:hypothetical protein
MLVNKNTSFEYSLKLRTIPSIRELHVNIVKPTKIGPRTFTNKTRDLALKECHQTKISLCCHLITKPLSRIPLMGHSHTTETMHAQHVANLRLETPDINTDHQGHVHGVLVGQSREACWTKSEHIPQAK